MHFTDIFIRRPVLASVVSLLILVLGLRAYSVLPILQYPRTENAIVTITTIYYGADPDVVAGFITTPLENAVAQANGIDYMTSSSQTSTSTISVYLRLNYDPDKALTEINTKVNSVLNQLPIGTLQPTLTVQIGQTIDAMYIGFNSDTLAPNQITDYLLRVVQPRLQAVVGVQTAELLGQKIFSLRAWLDPQKLAAFGLSPTDVTQALAANDYISGIGTTKGQMVQVNLAASTSLHTADEFRNLVIKQVGGAVVRLKDVANVVLGAEDYESEVGFDGKQAVYIGIQVAPAANLLDVIAGVHKIFPDIQAELPHGLNGEIIYDSTEFVHSAIDEVIRSLLEALAIVTVVVFLFLGSIRSSIIPTVAIPLSLIGTFVVLLALGYSINLLTLLALVLGIGLVVDDAIIVVENVNRHLEEGMGRIEAAIQAARELGGPIIAMTVVLAAVYVPIGFQSGLTGALFSEFAFALVGAVTVSGIVALTLSPMLCSRLLKPAQSEGGGWEARLTRFIDRNFARLRGGYERRLHGSLNTLPVTLVFALIVLSSIYFLFTSAKTELAPIEDQGVIITQSIAAPNSTLQQRQLYSARSVPDFRVPPRDRACLSTRYARPVDCRYGIQAVGPALQEHERPATGSAAGVEQSSGCAHRCVSAAAITRQHWATRSIRHCHDRTVRPSERNRAAIFAAVATKRDVHFSRQRSEDRQSAIRYYYRSRQDRAARTEDERRRRRARRRCSAAAMSIISASAAGPIKSFRRFSSASGSMPTSCSIIISALPTARWCRCPRSPPFRPRRCRNR